MFLVSSIVFVTIIANGFLIFFTLTGSLLYSAVMGVGIGLLGTTVVFGILYAYPSFLGSKKTRSIEESLPYTLSFMSVLATAGVPPRRIFANLATLEQEGKVGLGGEAMTMYRDMEFMGDDTITVLRRVADRRYSPLFSEALEGIISTIRSGGDFARFLQEEAKSLMRLRRSIMKEFLDSLVMISELYISLMVAFPLILIVMLVVMSSIAGGNVGSISPDLLVPLIIYVMIPGAGTVLLLMLDSVSKK
jgi:flagellar protein FlaJ